MFIRARAFCSVVAVSVLFAGALFVHAQNAGTNDAKTQASPSLPVPLRIFPAYGAAARTEISGTQVTDSARRSFR